MTTAEQLIEHAFTDEGGPLPEIFFLTTITRERVARMDPDTQAQALGAWQATGFPPARDAEGNSVFLPPEQLRAISMLLSSFEQSVSDIAVIHAVTERMAEFSDGERWTAMSVARGHGIENVSGLIFTTGQLFVLGRIIDRIVTLRDEAPATAPAAVDLEPLPEPGRTVTEPVDEPGDLDLVPPSGSVGDVVAWVDGNPHKAAKALEAERKRAKPRSTLVAKLELLADHGDAPAPAGPVAPTFDGDPFDGINGEAPKGVAALADAVAERDLPGVVEALAENLAAPGSSTDRAAAEPPGLKIPNIPPPQVTLAGGRITPEHAIERIGVIRQGLSAALDELDQLEDRIRRENAA